MDACDLMKMTEMESLKITTHRIFWQKISKKPNFHHISQTLSVNQEVKGYI
jgi:hypothetical protein